ncbi:MAG TPA: pitrilysin family protein [bacterium]|nr:pitrilysin family protein [bacterium]
MPSQNNRSFRSFFASSLLRGGIGASFFLCLGVLRAAGTLDLPVVEKTLKNGMKVLIVERPGVPVVSFSYMVPVGAQDAPKGKTGLPHMLEHMMFKGTETIGTRDYAKERTILDTLDRIAEAMNAEKAKLQPSADRLKELAAKMKKLEDDARQVVVKDELSAIYTRNGGQSLNAWTSQDVTNYHITLPANKVLLYCTVEKDRLAHPVFREFYSERNVVAQERRWRTESSPQGALYEALESTAFQGSPYKDPSIGWMSDIFKLTRPDAVAFYRQCYRPDHGVLAVVGGVKAKEILPILESTLGQVPNPKAPPLKKEWTVEPPQKGPRTVVARFDADPMAILAWHVPNFPHQESVVLDVLSTILTSGNTSRLMKSLIFTAKKATSVSSSTGFPGDRDPNLFTIDFTPAPGTDTGTVADSIEGTLKDIQKNGVTLEELERARRAAESSYLWGKTSAEGLAQDLAYNQAVHGDWRYLTRYLDMVRSVTSKDIQDVVARYLTEDNRTLATLERPTP